MAQSAGACRWLWNWALDYREAVWLGAKSAGAVGLAAPCGASHLCSLLKQLKREHPWLAEAPHHALQHTLRDLDQAVGNFFAGRADFPRYRRKGAGSGFRFPDPKQFSVSNGGWARLPKLGWVRFRQSRPVAGKVKSITISPDGGHWFMALCVEGEFSLPNAGADGIGLDAGVAQDITTPRGDVIDLGAPTERERRKLARLQRIVSRRTRGSRRRQRAQARVAKLKRHLANRRKDLAHKATTKLATTHRFVAIEDLKLRNMTASAAGTVAEPGRRVRQKAGLNRELLARGHADFRRMLAYKCERAGVPLILVNPAYTSQTCPHCQHVAPENRKSQAEFRCIKCGFSGNADAVAATNIMAAGQAVYARGGDHKTVGNDHSPGETRPHQRDRTANGSARLGIPANAAKAA